MAEKLGKLGIKTVEDLLYWVPFRYNDFSLVSPIARTQPGETVTVRGKVTSIKNAFTKTGKKLQQAKVADQTGTIDVIWFNQMYLTRVIRPGDRISLSGKVDWFGHKIVMISPEYEISEGESLHTGRLVPVYSETAGLSSKWLRGRIAFVLKECLPSVKEFLPEEIRSKYRLIGLHEAIQTVHFPKMTEEAKIARERLSFDELFLLQLRAQEQKRLWEETKKAHLISHGDVSSFITSLPFALTRDQKKALTDILSDLEKSIPMNRLLEGDVGSGKTVVSAAAMFVVYRSRFRSILMAPTEILALQHAASLKQFLAPHGVSVGILTGSKKDKTTADVLVGTHALLAKTATFTNVGLLVIDEQQRFGVSQRTLLTEKTTGRTTPHLLTMTATPIPRTVARTIWGNLDLSVLTDMPLGRKPVKTWLVPKEKREKAYQWIKRELAEQDAQAFIVCPLIEESETLTTVRAAAKEFEFLSKKIFPDLRLGLLHGRLKAQEKTRIIDDFRAHQIDILVTTPVVEVGVDIPNATVMLVEASERFGLSQLHQLRGRVGRGEKPSYCLLFTENETEHVVTRLKTLETNHSGPLLAEIDLKLRGPGELFGTAQHGVPELKVATFSDEAVLRQAGEAAKTIDPKEFPLLREKLGKGTIGKSALAD